MATETNIWVAVLPSKLSLCFENWKGRPGGHVSFRSAKRNVSVVGAAWRRGGAGSLLIGTGNLKWAINFATHGRAFFYFYVCSSTAEEGGKSTGAIHSLVPAKM